MLKVSAETIKNNKTLDLRLCETTKFRLSGKIDVFYEMQETRDNFERTDFHLYCYFLLNL